MTKRKDLIKQAETASEKAKSVTPPARSGKAVLPAARFPVVGIGASAGGLAAFEAFFSGMPAETQPGMAFVLLQHLAPDHKSMLSDLVRRYTHMQVFEAEDGTAVQINCVYVIPPNRDMAILNGTLQLLEPLLPRAQRMPIDFFFRSLAQDLHEQAVGVVLSGAGSDGTAGVGAIKGEGGMVMAQNPESAAFDGMPRSALATGLVDYELPPAEMPAELIAYTTNFFGRIRNQGGSTLESESALKKIFVLLRAQTGHDFSQYKPSTIQRRIERRIIVRELSNIDSYVTLLQHQPEEVEALFQDILIGVTNFFRDPEAFKALEEQVIPRLFAGKGHDTTIRIWVPGCSSGEEAYSLAILLAERQEVLKRSFKVQVFATDLNSRAIAKARAGVYSAEIIADITQGRLARYFEHVPGEATYRIHRGIRDMVVFSEQDVIKDPCFSRLDLISCRNLMIYLDRILQKNLFMTFHQALNPGGYLFLGTSESVGEFSDLFVSIESRQKIYQRQESFIGARRPARFLPVLTAIDAALPRIAGKQAVSKKLPLRELAEQALLQQIVPSAVLVNALGDILYLHGRTGMYLEPAPGEAGPNNILKMAREGLRRELVSALHKTVTTGETVLRPALRVKTNGDFSTVKMIVRAVVVAPSSVPEERLFLVILEKVLEPANQNQTDKPSSAALFDGNANLRIADLTNELQSKEEYLQSITAALENSNEELKSFGEEMQSVNEELQSSNEELETSKEELQSINEELGTVNAELHIKVVELSRVINDMNNLLSSTGIATIFLDHKLHIKRFTPAATKIINLIQTDIDRQVDHISSNLLGYATLTADINAVLDTLIPREAEVQTKEGLWYNMRILPDRTMENVIEGAVLTFVDISEKKAVNELLRANLERLRVALSSTDMALFTQDTSLRYTWIANPHPGFSAEQVIGKTDADLLSAAQAAPLTALKQQVLQSGVGVRKNVKMTIDGRARVYELNIEPMRNEAGNVVGLNCASLNVTRQPGL